MLLFYAILALWNTIMNDFLQKKVFALWHTDPRDDTVFNGVMDWFKALRWNKLRIHNNSISTSQPTCITKVTCTPLLRHLHTSSTNIQKDAFSASTLLLLSLSITCYFSSSISPTASIPIEESWGNTGIRERLSYKNHVSSNTPPSPSSCACSAPLQQCAYTLFEAKDGGRKEWRGATAQSTRLQYKNEQRWMGERGRGALTRREQHNLINTNARSKLFKHASNSALTRSRNTTDGWANQRRWDAITCGAASHTHARSNTRRSKREGWCLWWKPLKFSSML